MSNYVVGIANLSRSPQCWNGSRSLEPIAGFLYHCGVRSKYGVVAKYKAHVIPEMRQYNVFVVLPESEARLLFQNRGSKAMIMRSWEEFIRDFEFAKKDKGQDSISTLLEKLRTILSDLESKYGRDEVAKYVTNILKNIGITIDSAFE